MDTDLQKLKTILGDHCRYQEGLIDWRECVSNAAYCVVVGSTMRNFGFSDVESVWLFDNNEKFIAVGQVIAKRRKGASMNATQLFKRLGELSTEERLAELMLDSEVLVGHEWLTVSRKADGKVVLLNANKEDVEYSNLSVISGVRWGKEKTLAKAGEVIRGSDTVPAVSLASIPPPAPAGTAPAGTAPATNPAAGTAPAGTAPATNPAAGTAPAGTAPAPAPAPAPATNPAPAARTNVLPPLPKQK